MAEIDEIRAKVSTALLYSYSGDPDDGDGSVDRIWINKKQKHEVDYAIAKCLVDCDATCLASDVVFIRRLEEKIQNMDHDSMGRCKRDEAYRTLKVLIGLKKIMTRPMK